MEYKTSITTNNEKFIQAGKRYYRKLNSRPLKIYYTAKGNPYFKRKNKTSPRWCPLKATTNKTEE